MITQMEQAVYNLSRGDMEEDGLEMDAIMGTQNIQPFLVAAGQPRITVPGLKGFELELLHCYHPAETVGYGFVEIKHRMKPEYQKLSGQEKKQFSHDGVVMTERIEEPRLVFFGDTHIGALVDHDEWTRYPCVIVECTLYGGSKSPEQARRIGHIHWDYLLPIIESHPSTFFVVIHASLAMRSAELEHVEREVKQAGRAMNFKIWYE